MNIEVYKDEIVHMIGGLSTIVGELIECPHEEPEWYRLKNPVRIIWEQKGDQARIHFHVIGGQEGMFKRDFMDFKIPQDAAIELNIVDKESDFYKSYKRALETPIIRSSAIVTPDSPDFFSPQGVSDGKVVGAIRSGKKNKKRRPH